MNELIKKFLLKVGLRKSDDPSGNARTEADAETQGENEAKGDEREKTSPKEPPVVKPLSQGKSWWRIDFKQPKYIFPLAILLPILFLGYELMGVFGGADNTKKGVATDSINASLPTAANDDMGDKMTEMNKRYNEEDAASAVNGIGEDQGQQDSLGNGYQEHELDEIDRQNAINAQRQKDMEALQQRLAQSRKHINAYEGGSYGGASGGGSRQAEMDDYAREVEAIQKRSLARQKSLERSMGIDDEDESVKVSKVSQTFNAPNRKPEEKPAIVKKVMEGNADKFNTVSAEPTAEVPLIRAMIDKTTKAHEGTRLRFKLLDDVTLKGTKLKKGTYLYGTVTGFGQQRVMATITSILVRDKFIKVGLSVYDNDGMEGFYVPESAFRDLMKDAKANALQSNINFDGGYGGGLISEAVALQALQNMYQSATSAVSANIRKNKARIKYNTIVYLVNTGME
jgi:conjugative transposon TraM protein